MSGVIETIRAKLEADTAVTSALGDRIYPQVAPADAAVPYAVMTVVSEVPENTVNGAPADRLMTIRLQVDVYGRTYLDAKSTADAVDAVIAGLSEPDLSAQLDSSQEMYEDGATASGGLHRVSMDYMVWM